MTIFNQAETCNRFARSFFVLLVFITALGITTTGHAQETFQTRIQSVSQKAKNASTATQYSELITECDNLLKEKSASPSHRNYLNKLNAWALDKRGVTRTELAEQFLKANSSQQAEVISGQAMDDFNRSISQDPKRWQTHMHRGTLLAEKEKFQAAAKDFTAVIELNPESAAASFNRAEMRYQESQFALAEEDYSRAIQLDDEDLQALSGRGHCRLAQNQLDAALQDYDHVVKKLPNDAWALANRADVYLAMHDWQAARNDLRNAIEKQTNGEFCRRLGWLLATCSEESICDGQQALTLAKKAIAIGGESQANLDTLAAAYAAAGDFNRARDVHSRVIAMNHLQDPQTSVKQTAYENNERYQEAFDR